MTRVYYKEAIGAIVVFDLTRPATYEAAAKWKKDIDEKVCLPDGSRIPVILVANKRDLAGVDSLPISIEQYSKEHGFIGWFETSAKDNVNIEEACRFLVQNIIDRELLNPSNANENDPSASSNKRILSATSSKPFTDSKCCWPE